MFFNRTDFNHKDCQTYVQIPIFCPRSRLKNISVTTAVPMADAGEMKMATKIRTTHIEAYVLHNAQPTLQIPAPRVLMSQTGRLP